MTKPKGWREEPKRHSLASRGIKTGTKTRTPLNKFGDDWSGDAAGPHAQGFEDKPHFTMGGRGDIRVYYPPGTKEMSMAYEIFSCELINGKEYTMEQFGDEQYAYAKSKYDYSPGQIGDIVITNKETAKNYLVGDIELPNGDFSVTYQEV